MKRLFILLYFILLFQGTFLYAGILSMKELRFQERKAALNDFKKIHLHRMNYRHKLYKKEKHRRLKKVSRHLTPTMNENAYVTEITNELHESMEVIRGNDANIRVTANEDMDFLIKSGGDMNVYKEYENKKEITEILGDKRPDFTDTTPQNNQPINTQDGEKKIGSTQENIEVITEITSDTTADTTATTDTATDTTTTTDTTTDTTTTDTTTTSSTTDTSSSTIRARYINPWARKR